MTGATFGPPHAPYLPERIRLRLEVTETSPGVFCWCWEGATSSKGYGAVSWHGRRAQVHRVAWAAFGRPLLPGLVLDHLCGVRSCANPWHLQQTTHRVNGSTERSDRHASWRDGRCQKGHDLTAPAAAYVRPNGDRECRRCHADRNRQKGTAA